MTITSCLSVLQVFLLLSDQGAQQAFFDVVDVLHTLGEIRVGHLLKHIGVAPHDDADGVFGGRALRGDLGGELLEDRLVFEDADVEIEDVADLFAVTRGDFIAKAGEFDDGIGDRLAKAVVLGRQIRGATVRLLE